MNTEVKKNIKKLINVFEMGVTDIKYSQIYIYGDGPGSRRQITLSFGITEYGNLKKLIQIYIAQNGVYADKFKKFVDKIGSQPLVDNSEFKSLLAESSKKDPIMRDCQERIYDIAYWDRAQSWFEDGGFKTNLAMAVIMDSFIHSGSIPSFLRNKFSTKLPISGGNEKDWIKNYCQSRKVWLANHSRKILRGTVYRVNFFLSQIEKGNWGLDCPFSAEGVKIC